MKELIKEALEKFEREYPVCGCGSETMERPWSKKVVKQIIATTLTEARKKCLEEEIAYWRSLVTPAVPGHWMVVVQKEQISRLEAELKARDK